MPQTVLLLYQEDDGTVPLVEWLEALPEKARVKCRVRLGRLAQLGHELRRPEADLLRDEIYELRVGLNRVNYRMLYFFYGQDVVVVSHGLTKRKTVPPKEIDDAVKRKKAFQRDPVSHTYREE
jgi:phage-related protein